MTSRPSWTPTSSRSSTARSRFRPSRDPEGLTRGPGGRGSVSTRAFALPWPAGRSQRREPDRGVCTITDSAIAQVGTGSSQAPAVELRGITKRFPGVVANKDIEITVRRGTVHAIVGENGAGKSTLMKILYGVQRPDEGTITVDGREVHLHSPSDAIAAGIGMVFQHFMLADNLTVLENVGIGEKARARIEQISSDYGLDVHADDMVADLGVGKRQRVEILKVLYRGAK